MIEYNTLYYIYMCILVEFENSNVLIFHKSTTNKKHFTIKLIDNYLIFLII